MNLGILKEIKKDEHRVICTPAEVRVIASHGHRVLAQKDCGLAAGFPDGDYISAGARIADSAAEIFEECDLVAKVKEIEPCEYGLLREGQTVFACLHPAANPNEVDALIKSRCIAITAEDVHRYGSPNCEAAGKLGALLGIESMLTTNGGKGLYVGSLAGAPGMRVLILGGGLVGRSALSVLYSLGARCTLADISLGVLRSATERYGGRVDTVLCSKEAIARLLPNTDMVINCVKWQKERRDFLIDKDMLRLMEKGSVIVDISNDAPGAIESSHPTSFSEPRYVTEGVVHCCLPNIPSAVARSSSIAYASVMLPHILSILDNGTAAALEKDEWLRKGLVTDRGTVVHKETLKIRALRGNDSFPCK